jgi:hypothetical protein
MINNNIITKSFQTTQTALYGCFFILIVKFADVEELLSETLQVFQFYTGLLMKFITYV